VAGRARSHEHPGTARHIRTGIKCVGNSVLLHGIPYAPPYVIVAIATRRDRAGAEQLHISAGLPPVHRRYGLGYSEKRISEVTLDAYTGAIELGYAKPQPK